MEICQVRSPVGANDPSALVPTGSVSGLSVSMRYSAVLCLLLAALVGCSSPAPPAQQSPTSGASTNSDDRIDMQRPELTEISPGEANQIRTLVGNLVHAFPVTIVDLDPWLKAVGRAANDPAGAAEILEANGVSQVVLDMAATDTLACSVVRPDPFLQDLMSDGKPFACGHEVVDFLQRAGVYSQLPASGATDATDPGSFTVLNALNAPTQSQINELGIDKAAEGTAQMLTQVGDLVGVATDSPAASREAMQTAISEAVAHIREWPDVYRSKAP